MLRDLIAWVLNNYLGRYVGNLNTAQLTIDLLSGEVELENLPLRRDALRSLGWPLQALTGNIGKIKLQVPIRQLRSAPWCITIEQVYIVVGPYNLEDWDADVEEQAELDSKLSRLDRLEAKWRAARETSLEGGLGGSYYASSYSGWMSYGTSTITHVVENMQLKITDVHIRYEDSITIPHCRFACGITIDSLSVESCDANWQPGIPSAAGITDNASFKLLQLHALNVYWDPLTNSEVFGESNPRDLASAMRLVKWNHRFVMSPVTAQAKLKRDRSKYPLRTRNRPRFLCDLVVKDMSLTLVDWQYDQMVVSVRGLEDIAKYRRFRLVRPTGTVRDSPKSWWLYACYSHGLLRSKEHKRQPNYVRDSLRYLKIYLRIIKNPNETLSADEKSHKDEMERQRSYEELKILREVCMELVPIVPRDEEMVVSTEKGRGMLLQWFPQWWGWYKPTDPGGDHSEERKRDKLTMESGGDKEEANKLEDDILNALSVSVDNNSVFKRDAVFGNFEFTLKRGTMDICSGDPETLEATPMLQLQFENLLLCVETRPRSASYFVGLSLGTVCLKDRITKHTEFPDLMRPQQIAEVTSGATRKISQQRLSTTVHAGSSSNSVSPPLVPVNSSSASTEPLFALQYECKPLLHNTDYRLLVKTQSLDIVYNTGAIKWLIDFTSRPHQILNTKRKIEAIRNRTRKELIKNWETILEGNVRKTWTFEIDISAPQIIFVDDFSNKNGIVMLVDFGRLQLSNGQPISQATSIMEKSASTSVLQTKTEDNNLSTGSGRFDDDDDDDDDTFLTPCSTPPGSNMDSPTLCTAIGDVPEIINNVDSMPLNETNLHNKIYDKYTIDLTDLQVLVCKGKDSLLAACAKTTSPLHILDRFNISLKMERRVVMTTDPQYPSLKICGTLPKLVVHMNEMKVAAINTMWVIFSDREAKTKTRSPTNPDLTSHVTAETKDMPDDEKSEDSESNVQREQSKLVILQFAIDQMVLEVQSRGRGIAELQVSGVKAGFSKRPTESSVSLSVHGLLLADAIQSFGPDFELLIASHRHVGIDSVSGSLKHSEPCSPTSPGSPDPMGHIGRPTSPHTISRALSSLQKVNSSVWDAGTDLDALITVEISLVTSLDVREETTQIANIQFNNLDIIANQETIVELIGFTKRVFPQWSESSQISDYSKPRFFDSEEEIDHEGTGRPLCRTEITFDFHRLNVLILRAVMRDDFMVGRKVGTFTMSEARIHATIGNTITVEGSLGGLQVLDLTPEGINHQRILSVGKDPLTEPPNLHITKADLMSSLINEIYTMEKNSRADTSSSLEERQALSFFVTRNADMSIVDVQIRMASLWYTHCARFVQELTWCASEFADYLKNLAKSIREKATDMALGLVQPRLDVTPRFPHGKVTSGSLKMTHAKSGLKKVVVRLDIVLDTPVMVVPRSSDSTQVFVAHLGKISVSNFRNNVTSASGTKPLGLNIPQNNSTIFTISEDDDYSTEVNEFLGKSEVNDVGNMFEIDDLTTNVPDEVYSQKVHLDAAPKEDYTENYDIDVRNMNLFTLDTCNRKAFRMSALPRAEEFYSCAEGAVAVLHDTAIQFNVVRSVEDPLELMAESATDVVEDIQVTGSVVEPLHLSLSKQQYEQLLETMENIFKVPAGLVRPRKFTSGASTLDCNPSLVNKTKGEEHRYSADSETVVVSKVKTKLQPRVAFCLPLLTIQLKNEKNVSLIEMAFRDFNFDYHKNSQFDTNVQISLKSILIEDLMQPISSKNRIMVTSQASNDHRLRASNAFGSISCPNLVGLYNDQADISVSLPENLENRAGFFRISKSPDGAQKLPHTSARRSLYPETPPPSPQPRRRNEEHLVVYSALIVEPDCPSFVTQYKSMRQSSSIDFNSLDLRISVLSLFNLLDFFGLSGGEGDEEVDEPNARESQRVINEAEKLGNSELDISIRSLSVILVKPTYEIAKANVSNARFIISKKSGTKTVQGSLGSMSLLDLSEYGHTYRERFLSSGYEALSFTYAREKVKSNQRTLQKDAELKIQMSTIRYVHTKRFVMDIQIFFKDFLQLQSMVMRRIQNESRFNLLQRPSQLGLEIIADSPIVILPMSAYNTRLIFVDLGQFRLTNTFLFSRNGGVISKSKEYGGEQEILDVMNVNLVNTDLYTGARYPCSDSAGGTTNAPLPDDCLHMGSFVITKEGPSILQGKLQLNLQVERNMDSWKSHNVPDISVQGTLSSVEAVLNLSQYKLVRGFLAYNLGECIDDLYVEPTINLADSVMHLETGQQGVDIWTSMSITLDLQNVAVQLKNSTQDDLVTSRDLARINFIKSSLKIESFTDGSQDIDLISQEILISDIRIHKDASGDKGPKNVFENILKPIDAKCQTEDFVQAEIYSRKKNDISKYTILLNNMRLIAILDWLESARDFLFQSPEEPMVPPFVAQTQLKAAQINFGDNSAFELVLNITDSELIFVENTDRLDTNAVILRSTTILSYRPNEIKKAMSINLNHLEVFSCILGSEEETALSIIDPMTVNLDIRDEILDIHFHKRLCIRLSYNDIKMFQKMAKSLPKQTKSARSSVRVLSRQDSAVAKLVALGFLPTDCERAMVLCHNRLDNAALWLTHNAEPTDTRIQKYDVLAFKSVELRASLISICVIDDCKDADVPLLEFSLTELELRQERNREDIPHRNGFKAGNLKGTLFSAYYNRFLSGWEPLIEPWKCAAHWTYSLGQLGTEENRFVLDVSSSNQLNFNLTSTVMELYQQVRDNWLEDYYGNECGQRSVQLHRRRSPFVPFALKNETGLKLYFTTLVSMAGNFATAAPLSQTHAGWTTVEQDYTIPLTFSAPHKLRHFDSHKLNLHQITVRLEGWREVGPISVDKVGIYFRTARMDATGKSLKTRIVFAVTMEGSAQKLITVRSSLRVLNKLDTSVQLKLDHLYTPLVNDWPEAITSIVKSGATYNVPISHVHAFLHLRPTLLDYRYDSSMSYSRREVPISNTSEYWKKFNADSLGYGMDTIYQYTDRPIHWKEMTDTENIQQEYRACKSNRDVPYRIVVAMKRERYPERDIGQIPGHTMVLYPPLRIYNLLPCDLLYRLHTGVGGSVAMSKTANVYEIDPEAIFELNIMLEGYPGSGTITILPGLTGTTELMFNLTDTQMRPLHLHCTIAVIKGCGIQVSISASFWLVNRTGLPLIFKEEMVNYESSGQFSEHEEARLLSPLMFSFSDPDAQLTVRLGKRYGANPPFCAPINLHKEFQNRKLKAASSMDVFTVGVDIRRGRGRYSKTSVVTFCPQYQIYNRSSYKLQFAQKCYAMAASDPLARATFIEAVPDCHIPFHWPQLDRVLELCVRLPDELHCLWSGGIRISETASCYINIRNRQGDMHFLRLEIVLQGASYFLLFGNAQVLPPPIRIDNFSEVPIRFQQPNERYTEPTTVRPKSSMAYVLDEPMGQKCLRLEPPGGISYVLQLNELNSYDSLSYENFTYIAFMGTFKNFTSDISKTNWEYNVENSQLVLQVVNGDRVVLMKKQPGNRNQLWRLNRNNQLEHEGSSPPTEPGVKRSNVQRFVLDLEHPPQPTQYVGLRVREINPQRKYTQTWTFTEEGRLMCLHANMCVQAANGVFGLRHGSDAVYGMIVSDKQNSNQLVPIEQAIETQKQRPGSGVLTVKVAMDGPITNIRIYDVRHVTSNEQQTITLDDNWPHVSYNLNATRVAKSQSASQFHRKPWSADFSTGGDGTMSINEFHITVKLQRGIGLSLVSREPCKELMFIMLENISLEFIATAVVRNIILNVGDLQIDNQLLDTPCPVMLYTNKLNAGDSPEPNPLPAIAVSINMLPSPNKNAVIFQYFIIQLRPMSIYLEERLLLRMVDFLGLAIVQQDAAQLSDESDFEAQRVATKLMAANAKRYYFGKLEVMFSQNRVSVITAAKLSPRLSEIKRAIGLTLIKFEDAVIDFEKFSAFHQFETLEVYLRAIKSHYIKELKWQATSILGSVDFLGNPFGLASDLTEGVSGLIFEGSVTSLVKNVTHGISNSTAKLTETISDGLGRVVLDEEDTETRQRILEVGISNNSANHLVAGLKGFGFGLLGGVTSIVKHTYTGAQNDGLPGFISGLGMGLVGTVTKPVIGVLDLASETANAVREKSRSSHRILPERKRNPRCVSGAPGKLLPPFSNTQSKGLLILYSINKRNFAEQLVEYEPCLFKKSLLRIIVSTENVLVFTRDDNVTKITLSCHLSELISCNHVITMDDGDSFSDASKLQVRPSTSTSGSGDSKFSKGKARKHYIQLCMNITSKSLTSSTQMATQGPLVRCQSEEMAQRLSRIINYAKGMYDERELTLTSLESNEENIK